MLESAHKGNNAVILSHADSGRLAAWYSWPMTRKLEKDEACEFCYAPAVSACIRCGTAVCEECSETRNGQAVCNDCIEGENREFDAGGEG